MHRVMILSATVLLLVAEAQPAARADGLEAGGVEFAPSVSVTSGNGEHELRCTGTALRKKWFFKVYAIAAYLDAQTAAGADPGATWVSSDVPRLLHLRMLRDVEAKKITSSIDEALEKCSTTPLEQIQEDRARFQAAFAMDELHKGQDIRLTWIPGAGLQISVDAELLDTISNPLFARSLFEIYFGPAPVNDDMKRDLLQLVTDSE